MKLSLRIALSTCVLAFAAAAQTSIYIGGGPSYHSEAPRAAFNLTTGICSADTGRCALINYSARAAVRDLKTVVYSTSFGLRQVLARAESPKLLVDLFALGDAGAAVSPEAVGFAGAGGGGLTFHPKSAPNWGISFAAQASYAAAGNGGWKPNLFAQVGYTFRAVK
jgi:hypothetical protein